MSCDAPASPVSETKTGLSEAGPAIDVRQVSKVFNVYHQPIDRLKQALFRGRRTFYTSFAALNDVTFTVPLHQTVGIIGENGSGKSTLLQIISGLLIPSAGSVAVDGRVSALLELGAGFNPAFTGRENVYMNAAILGLSREEVDERYDQIVRFSGLEEFMERNSAASRPDMAKPTQATARTSSSPQGNCPQTLVRTPALDHASPEISRSSFFGVTRETCAASSQRLIPVSVAEDRFSVSR